MSGVLSHGGLRKSHPEGAVMTGFYRSPGIAGVYLLTAPSGSGKSSALSYLAHQIVGGQALPVLLSADQWESCWHANPHFDLPAILHHLFQSLANAPSIEHWRQWLQQGRAVLLVDKLESVATNQSFRDQLRQILQTSPLLKVVLAVRVEWLSWFEALALPVYRLLPLSEAQTHALVRSLEDLLGRSTPHATSFAGNPFLCTAACFIEGSPPTGQGRFLQQLFEALLRQAGDIGLPIFRAIGLIYSRRV
jgi:hypothetical protein